MCDFEIWFGVWLLVCMMCSVLMIEVGEVLFCVVVLCIDEILV